MFREDHALQRNYHANRRPCTERKYKNMPPPPKYLAGFGA